MSIKQITVFVENKQGSLVSITDTLAKRDMHIQAQVIALLIRQHLVIFIFEDKGLGRTCQPHSGQRCNDTHITPICISGRLSTSQV